MMGQHTRSESLFYYFRLEDHVPANHLLRLIDTHINFSFVREQLKDSYSDTGRPSIDPELLLRIVLIGYLYGISSERKLVEELRMSRRDEAPEHREEVSSAEAIETVLLAPCNGRRITQSDRRGSRRTGIVRYSSAGFRHTSKRFQGWPPPRLG